MAKRSKPKPPPIKTEMISADADPDSVAAAFLESHPDYELAEIKDYSGDRRPYRELVFRRKGSEKYISRGRR